MANHSRSHRFRDGHRKCLVCKKGEYPGLSGRTCRDGDYGYLLYVAGYYGDMIVNIYFTVMSVYGWYNWSRHRNAMPLQIGRTNSFEKLTGFGLFCLTIVVIFQIYR